MNTLEEAWQKRSKLYKRQIEGVLPKSFPKRANLYLDRWMFEQTQLSIPKNKKVKILDLGCGYGRLSKEILEAYPKAQTLGVDIAENYVNYYNQDLKPRGKAIKGDIRKLKFPKESFDIVIIVTTLIYLSEPEDREESLKHIFSLLKKNGKFVIIERNKVGQKIITGGGLVDILRGKKNKEIESVSFTDNYLRGLIEKQGGVITHSAGIPFWTLMLPLMFLFNRFNKIFLEITLRLVRILDNTFSRVKMPSLYISYVGRILN